MYWGQFAVAVTVALVAAGYLSEIGYSVSTIVAVALIVYVTVRWLIAWVYRVRYWVERGTRGHRSRSCPSCGQYIYRQSGDWVLQCKRCGWTLGPPGLRWVLYSVPARQLQRTIDGPRVFVVVIAVFLIVSGIDIGAVVGGVSSFSHGPASTSSGSPETVLPATSTPRREPTDTNANPWGKDTVVVAVRNQAAPDRNVTDAVAAALEYWDGHDYGVYSIEFELDRDAQSPDLIVWYNESIGCPDQQAAGCAPRLNSTSTPRPPEHVQIKYNRSSNFRQTRNVIIHEFGHVLGLGHCVEPYWVMSHRRYCDLDALTFPDVKEKEFAWRSHGLTYYVDYDGVPAREQTQEQVRHAIEYFEDGAGGTVPEGVSFTRVNTEWRGDIVISFGTCEGDYAACHRTWHSDPDADGAPEYHTKTEITIDQEDVSARGWYVGWSLAISLTPDALPSVFVDATYEERRSNWWE